jgi:hypothetical protein
MTIENLQNCDSYTNLYNTYMYLDYTRLENVHEEDSYHRVPNSMQWDVIHYT